MEFKLSSVRFADREAKREILLAHAREMLVDGGFDALTMPGLARRAGIAVGGIYRYFDGKEALIAALQIEALRALERRVAAAEGAGLDAVRAVAGAVLAFADDEPMAFGLLSLGLADPRRWLDDARAAEVDAAVAPLLAEVGRRIDAAVAGGLLTAGDTAGRVLALQGLVFGVLMQRKRARDRAAHDAARAALFAGVDAMLTGWST